MSSNWMNNCDDDFNDEPSSKRMSKKKAKRVRDISRQTYGGYVYDYDDRKAAQETLGNEYWE